MKLVVAIVQDQDALAVLNALARQGLRATKLASTGGFLREGNTTVLVGVEEDAVDRVLDILRSTGSVRREPVPPAEGGSGEEARPAEVLVGGATVFVLDVVRYAKF
ncbi:signal transduction receptor, cyclic di-AMP binding [Candidatus Hydrogenisulfobacillus filiaventi]|uniref:Signal transduction receptor, cyclic di-AMP binding n=1 Tax=Candidatus Hydrogenisulfobacillus filiaventi TaxID=2707344 RepID=A0A6F8ZKE4_9FIRM|nr:cyclic-di-AMP receptor [Bacillota bacterium]CAB1130136.1 signal transduction receptor, cyclic di-AMP binding [Candidatus Hydrogenisulfobacillus filiaventi]